MTQLENCFWSGHTAQFCFVFVSSALVPRLLRRFRRVPLSLDKIIMNVNAPTPDASRDFEGSDRENAGTVRRFMFTPDEREMCRTLVVGYRDIVESKESTNFANRLKEQAWERIAQEYNAQEGVRRVTVTQLRKLWDNEKTRWKKRQAGENRERFATGKYLIVFSICEIRLNTARCPWTEEWGRKPRQTSSTTG